MARKVIQFARRSVQLQKKDRFMSQRLDPIAYSTSALDRRPSLVTVVAIASLCLASLSLVLNGVLEKSSLHSLQAARQAPLIAVALPPRTAPVRTAFPPVVMRPPSAHQWRALTPTEIAGVISYINLQLAAPLGGQSVTEKQKQTLKKILSSPNQSMIDPSLSLNFESRTQIQVFRAMPSNDHMLWIAVRHGSALDIYRTRIDAEGRQIAFPTFGSATTRPFAPARQFASMPLGSPFAPSPPPNYHAQYISALISCILFAVQFALALLLLLAGIGLLMSKYKAVRLLWLFVIVKVIVTVLAASQFLANWANSAEPLQGPLGTPLVCVGLIYPIALVFILRGRTFRLYPGGGSAVIGFGFGDPRPPGFVALGTISFFVGILSLLVSSAYLVGSYSLISDVKTTHMAQQQSAALAAQRAAALARAAAHQPLPRAPTADEIAQFISILQAQLQRARPPMSLNPAQANSLKKLLGARGQQIIDPEISFGIPKSNQMQRLGQARTDQAGALHFTVLRGDVGALTSCTVDIDVSGNEVHPPTIELPMPPSDVNDFPQTTSEEIAQENAARFAWITFAFDLFPPVMLIIGAWLLLQGKPRGISFHRTYAWTKLITGFLTIVAVAIVGSASDSDDWGDISTIITVVLEIPIIVLSIYPIVLFFVMASFGSVPDKVELTDLTPTPS
jgi:hypothetical protein